MESESPVAATMANESCSIVDEATKPFEFRCSDPGWPVSQRGGTGALQVNVRSLLPFADRELVLTYELIRVEDGTVVGREQTSLQIDKDGNSASIPIADAAPTEVGVYEIRCQVLEPQDRIWNRLTRSPSPIAATKTPWIVIHPSLDPTAAEKLDVAANLGLRWRDKANIDRIDPTDWQRSAWMLAGATKLVPNVRRVGESLSMGNRSTTDHSADSVATAHLLPSGDSYVGMLSGLAKHQVLQLSIAIGDLDFDTRPSNVRVEFSNAPTFDAITRTVTLRCSRKKDVSSSDVSSISVHDLLHYPRNEDEFVRITNESQGGAIRIHSVTLSEPITGDPVAIETTQRRIKLWVHSVNWLGHLVPDYDQTAPRGDYAESTWQMYRVWKATTRLSAHAQWCGYDEVNLPVNFENLTTVGVGDPVLSAAVVQSPVNPFVANYVRNAIAGWVDTSRVVVVARQVGEEIPNRGVINGFGRQPSADAIDGEPFSAPTIQVLDFLVRNAPEQLSIHASELPQVFNRSFRHTLSHYRRTPANIRSAASLTATDTDYVSVFVSALDSHDRSASDENLAITVINTAPWSSNVKLRFSNSQISDCLIVAVDETNAVLEQMGTTDSRLLTIGPSSVVNLRLGSANGVIELVSWQAAMLGGAKTMEILKHQVGEVVGRIGTLALPEDYEQLRNGGFEIDGQVGIVGWMHTQFPESAVERDAQEAIEGSQSIRLTCDAKSAGRIWLVSEPITVPRSGRLAVSLAVRANKKTPVAKTSAIAVVKPNATAATPSEPMLHRMRVSLEGNQRGKPVRYSTEIDVPCDGLWQPRRIVLEIDQLSHEETDALRLTIDSLSPGKLWIDDIHLHDQFPTESERIALQDNAFLAIQGLQRGNLKPAAGLLNNDWSRYLLAKTERALPSQGNPLSPNRSPALSVEKGADPVVNASPAPVGLAPENDSPKASVAERLREWLPKPIRF